MSLAKEKLRILTFPQRIDGGSLELRILLLPTQALLYAGADFPSALDPGNTVRLPKFLNATLALDITTVHGLVGYPYSDPTALADEGSSADTADAQLAFPADLPALYEAVAAQFTIDLNQDATTVKGAGAPRLDSDGIRKYLPQTYRQAFNFTRPRTPFASIDDSYHCAIRRTSEPDPAFRQSSDDVTWGRVIAFCLRQPLLAERMGLLYRKTLPLPAADYFRDGGWVYCTLASALSDFDIAADELKIYAARIPRIAAPRQLFAAVLFPVAAKPPQPNGDFDTLKIEAADYDDGFAKIVHAVQPVSANLLAETPDGIHVQKDVGVRLGWDDEQLLIWQNRQLLADPGTPLARTDAPLGVFSYRVDVRQKGAASWESLVRVRSRAALALGGLAIAPAQTTAENGVQVFPVRFNAEATTRLWLPSYFTQWFGASLALPDTRAAELDASGALADPGTYSDATIAAHPAQKGGLYEPLLPQDTELKYGRAYEFRVRLADLAGGGPDVNDEELNDAPAPSASLVFRRYVAPKQLTITPLDPQAKPQSSAIAFLDGTSFDVARPRLGYPALLFTQMDTGDAMQKLIDDRDFLHTGKVGKETIREPRQVSWFDPDVDRFLVIVDVRTLALDTQASLDQREAFIPLYTTMRDFDVDPEAPFALTLEYRDADVIDFGNLLTLGDLAVSQTGLDAGGALVLPTSRDLRITLLPVCSDKAGSPAYFGFASTLHAGVAIRTGEPTQFFVRQDAVDEDDFFRVGLVSHQLQGLYLRPDPPQVNNTETLVTQTVEGSALDQATLMQRLASQLDCGFKGLTLHGRPGQRIQFGCSHRVRHTLAPDNASITFATTGDLVAHWLMAISLDVNRDWTWDGLADAGIAIERTRQFTGEAATSETATVGYVQVTKTANRVATGTDPATTPDRSTTRVLFIDAVEPKKDATKATTLAQPFPDTIDLSYSIVPAFIDAVDAGAAARESRALALQLPVTTIPSQVPKVVAAGYALSPYRHDDGYAATGVRERCLWLEFDRPIDDPNDGYFARVLGYAPDPLLAFANVDQVLVRQEDPPLAIAPEWIRIVTTDQGNDGAGLDAMDEMTPETGELHVPLEKLSPVHYLLRPPAALHADSPELFGFFVYELRVAHTDRIWSTAQGRHGHPMRLAGVQHPAPPLKCLVDRTQDRLSVSAHHATAVFNGRNVTSKPPKTELWCMLYAQLEQADGRGNRNFLLAEMRLDPVKTHTPAVGEFLAGRAGLSIRTVNSLAVNVDAPGTGVGHWTEAEIQALLTRFDLASDTSLSVLAVEMMPRYDQYVLFGAAPDTTVRPLSQQLGKYRILRTSPLAAAPAVCCVEC